MDKSRINEICKFISNGALYSKIPVSIDEKIERLQKRSAQLEKDIRDKSAEKKRIDTQIELLSYSQLKAEIGNHSMTSDDFAKYAKLVRKMEDNSVTFDDIDSMLDSLTENNRKEEISNEKQIF